MEESVASRLKLFIDTHGMTTSQFADMCGIPRPSLSQIINGRNKKISDLLIGQIHRAFPDLSVLWLLFGEGPVKTNGSNGGMNTVSAQDAASSDVKGIDDGFHGNMKSIGYCGSDDDGDYLSSGVNFADDVRENRTVGEINFENSNLNALKSGVCNTNGAKNQVFESDLKILDLKRQIEHLRNNPRKVAQITIYYDDSTFETFIPK